MQRGIDVEKEKYDILDGSLKIYTGTSEHIVIPPDVTEIDDMVFFNNTDIKSLTIPGNVRRIGQGAFFNCANLESVSIGTGVCEIASFAFKGCTSLKSVVIPDTIVQIEADAFDEKTTIIKESGVDAASKEESVSDEDKKTDRMFKMKRTNGGWMVERYIGDLPDITVPEHYHGERVVSIGEMAFAIEGDVTTDENGDEKQSFSSNDLVRSVTIPSSVRCIEDGAFMACINLEKIQLSEGLEFVGSIAFWGCESLKSIEFPRTCREIGNNAFEQCISLKKIKLNEGLTPVSKFSKSKSAYKQKESNANPFFEDIWFVSKAAKNNSCQIVIPRTKRDC